jgi:hypothetical protein
MHHKPLLRKNWVRFTKEKNGNRKKYTKEEMKKLFDWIKHPPGSSSTNQR